MKIRFALALLLLGSAGLQAYALAADRAPTSATTGATSSTPVLEKGMPAETILKYLGQPNDVTPMKSSDLSAEKWIYRRKVSEQVIQTANQQKMVSTFGIGSGGPTMVNAVVPDYHLKLVKTYQVTALLMVDGKLVAGKQWREQEEQSAD